MQLRAMQQFWQRLLLLQWTCFDINLLVRLLQLWCCRQQQHFGRARVNGSDATAQLVT
jgi:hypothetical protein